MKISEAKALGYSVKEPTMVDIKKYCDLIAEDYRKIMNPEQYVVKYNNIKLSKQLKHYSFLYLN